MVIETTESQSIKALSIAKPVSKPHPVIKVSDVELYPASKPKPIVEPVESSEDEFLSHSESSRDDDDGYQ